MNSPSKVKDRSVLKTILDGHKADGKTVVFTNGCFDILHVGHVRYLQQARELGDVLVVGVNSDERVRRLKGDGRPLVAEDDRAEVIAAFGFVDYVCIFPEDTPTELIAYLQPDVHVKGGDYKEEEMPEAETVRSYGGTIALIPLVHGRSTTNIVMRIVKNNDR